MANFMQYKNNIKLVNKADKDLPVDNADNKTLLSIDKEDKEIDNEE